MEEDLKDYYEAELKHLRSHADEFASRRPYARIAARLGLSANAALRDPFVEWLLQGYAFIAARVRRRLELEFPRFTQNLLSVVYPHLCAPTPSMIVAEFGMRPDPALLANGSLLPRETRLMMTVRASGGNRGRRVGFTTCRATRLWPVTVTEARYLGDPASVQAAGASRSAPAAISLTLAVTPPDGQVGDLGADDLAIHLAESEGGGGALFEALIAGGTRCEIAKAGPEAPEIALGPLGFDRRAPLAPADESAGVDALDAMLPRGPRSFDGYRLLHEFFALPARFHFIRLSGLRRALKGRKGSGVTILVLLDRAYPNLAGLVGSEAFRVNCAPAVNLFHQRADDISYSDRRVEHPILPDRGDPTSFEVHSVLKVRGVLRDGAEVTFKPFFAVEGLGARDPEHGRFHHVTRRARPRPERRDERDAGLDAYVGSDAYISIVDEAARPAPTDLKSLSLDLLCTNRHLPVFAMVEIGGARKLTCDIDGGWKEITVTAGPSAPRSGLPEGRRLWDVISHLSLNHLALIGEGPEGPETAAAALRQLLRLYAPERDVEANRLVDAIRRVAVAPSVRRAPPGSDRTAPMAFVRGLEITLTIDDDQDDAIPLAATLDRVLAGMAEANSFIELVVRRPDGRERARFAPRSGTRRLL